MSATKTVAKLLKRHEGSKFCQELLAITGGAIINADGTFLYGHYCGARRYPVVAGEETFWVCGDERAELAASLLQQYLNLEWEKKDLAAETLDKYRELNLIYRLSEKLSGCFSLEVLAVLVLEESQKLVRATGGTFLLWHPETERLEPIHAFGAAAIATPNVPLDQDITGRVFRSGKGEIVNDVSQDREFLMRQFPVGSMISVPMVAADRVVGVINFYHYPAIEFTARDLQLLTALALQAARSVTLLRLHDRELRAAVIRHELDNGRRIQRNFLPDRLIPIPGWAVETKFHPARQVSGDFYDLFALPSGGVAIAIADVCDKGVGSALFMALFRSLLRVFAQETPLSGLEMPFKDLVDGKGRPLMLKLDHINALRAVQMTNAYVASIHSNLSMFATLFFGVLSPRTGVLSYINGGHDSLYLLRNGAIAAALDSTGPPVGLDEDGQFQIGHVYFQPGDMLLGYTDGIPEARGKAGDFYTEERLRQTLSQPYASVGQMLDHLETEVLTHIGDGDQSDDITMIGVARLPGRA
jgi:sigma-B regulation protein RsbU (phosphoserine phosphatase)